MVNQKLVESLLNTSLVRAIRIMEMLGDEYGAEYHARLVQAVFDEHHRKAVK